MLSIPQLDSRTWTVAISLLLALFCFAVFVLITRRRSSSRRNALLLVGAPDAGKTAILSMLSYQQALSTLASLQTNSAVVQLSDGKNMQVIDVPGHLRIRGQFHQHLSNAKVVAFVVDSGTISRNGPIVAEHLHHVLHALVSLPPSQQQPALLVLAHKVDLIKASSASAEASPENLAIARVKNVLERELEKRSAQTIGNVGIEGLGSEGESTEMGGLECVGNGPFRFENWEGGDVTILATSATKKKIVVDEEKSEGDGLSSLRTWLEDCA